MNVLGRSKLSWALPLCLSLGLLCGAAAERVSLLPPKDATAYHARVKAAAGTIPNVIGDWVGTDKPVAVEAMSMLKPNAMVSRSYVNQVTHEHLEFLMVQCFDARTLVDHYPPICYVMHGYKCLSAEPRDWALPKLSVTGTEYQFARASLNDCSTLAISNFMVMPDGSILRDMEAVQQAAGDLHKRFYGAAQFQIVFDASTPQRERDAVTRQFANASQSAIDAIRNGAGR